MKYEHKQEIYQLPIPPEKMITKSYNTNKKYETIGMGEVNIMKGIGLREIFMTIMLPNDLLLPFVQPRYSPNVIIGKPILYLGKFREFKANKKPLQLLITRILPNGEEIFKGNINVTLEEYIVYENAGEEGDFLVDLVFREYVEIKEETLTLSDKNNNVYNITTNRTSKEPNKSYTVKSGDTLWKIAKRELNDETKYKHIMQLNNITDPKKLKVGTVLKLY
ncbi:LysM domain-containing protein [uncultured Tyzzerella sp.]|uniref:LysM peptidoglycan-binding domain-containing protein n=1 Tax=uncultured Tyzzerella sp. TaxID=2321398 RepID=UPI002943BDF0|nr:LysM domain-containing protein [uncultured Tyzzerella sp.]